MNGDAQVIQSLQARLVEERQAILLYMSQAAQYENEGYIVLHEQAEGIAKTEMRHAWMLMQRLLFLNGEIPEEPIALLRSGAVVNDRFHNALSAEQKAVVGYNETIQIADAAGDRATGDLIRKILADETEHVNTLETELSLLDDLKDSLYLSQRIK